MYCRINEPNCLMKYDGFTKCCAYCKYKEECGYCCGHVDLAEFRELGKCDFYTEEPPIEDNKLSNSEIRLFNHDNGKATYQRLTIKQLKAILEILDITEY